MKPGLPQAALTALLAGSIGAGISIYMRTDSMVGIVIAASVIGFLFGFFFKIRAT
jgi:hypothetical protein